VAKVLKRLIFKVKIKFGFTYQMLKEYFEASMLKGVIFK